MRVFDLAVMDNFNTKCTPLIFGVQKSTMGALWGSNINDRCVFGVQKSTIGAIRFSPLSTNQELKSGLVAIK